ncbi:MAG: ADOP family duplicated permease [Gemmatimonadaceae bacterium]
MRPDARTRRLFALDSARSQKAAVQRSVDDELAFHIANRADDLVRSGLSRAAAEVEARRQFGDLEAARSELATIDHRRLTQRARAAWWGDMLQDLRVALRTLRAHPGFTAVVLLTMALGIGANGAIYTVVDAALLRPLPFHRPEQLVHLWETKEGVVDDRSEASYPDLVDWRAQNTAFQAIEGYDPTNVTIVNHGAPARSQGGRVTSGFLSMLGARPLLGRTFAPGEDPPNGTPLVVLSHNFWQRHYAGDHDVLGRSLNIDGAPHTIIGVLRPGFMFAPIGEADVWLPLQGSVERRAERFNHWVNVVGRFKDDASVEGARSDLGTVMARLAAQYPETNAGRGIAVVPLRDAIVGDVRPTLIALFGAVALVLLIACANVASLLLARAMARGREMAVRVALGAGRGRLVRQMLTESLLLSLAGGVMGVWVANVATRALVHAIPENVRVSMPYLSDLSINGTVLAYLAGIALLTGVAFGLAPALYASRPALGALVSGDRRATAGTARGQLRNALVTFEVALTVVLLVGAGLLTRSLTRLLQVDPGFDPSQTLVLRIALPGGGRYSDDVSQQRFDETLLERTRAMPGVQLVGAVSNLPLIGGGTNTFRVEGQPEPDPARRHEAVARGVAGDYFRALGIRLVAGRAFDARDDSAATPVIMISESIARRFFAGRSAVGAKFQFYAWGDTRWTVIGVVGDVKTMRLDEAAPPTVYYSHLQGAENRLTLVVRSAGDLPALAASMRSAVRAMDPTLLVYAVGSMERVVSESPAVYARRYPLVLLGAFAAAALILAIVGIAGVISYSVSQRTREIGIRVALGAAQRSILSMVMRQGGSLALAGLAIGVIAALLSTRLLESLLYGVGATDPLTYATIAALIVGVALAASYVPARRATRVDPITVLRSD